MDVLRSAAVLLLVTLFTQLATLRAEDPCLLPRVVGRCTGTYERFFFNSSSGTCEPFFYGGCDANANNFETLEVCQLVCYNQCQQPKEPGPCPYQFPKFFFNPQTGACEEFIYGGCDGNRNNFDTLEDCQATCLAITPQP